MKGGPSEEASEEGAHQDAPGEVLSVRFGRSANCSSVGSVVDVLFVSSVVGTALLGALAVMIRGAGRQRDEDDDESEDEDEDPPDQA